MTYDSSRFRGDAAYTDDRDDGFRDSPAFRDSVAYREQLAYAAEEPTTTSNNAYSPGVYPAGGYNSGGYASGTYDPSTYDSGTYDPAGPAGYAAPEAAADGYEPLPYVARPARDRLAIHFGWEVVLAVAVAAVAFLTYRAAPAELRGGELDALYLKIAVLGLVAVGTALSLRAAVPNLALGPLTYATGMFFAENSDRGLFVTAAVAALLAVAAGVAIAVVVTALRVPAWAASLAAAFGLVAWIQMHSDVVKVVGGAYRPNGDALLWLAGFVGLSVLGGVLGLIPRARRAVGRYRPAGDPTLRRRGAGIAALGLVGSSVLAGVAGVLLALTNRQVTPTETGLGLTGLALGAALLGGTSVYGRRGGLFGTALAVILLALLVKYGDAEGWVVNNAGLAATALGVGLLISRVIEALGGGRDPNLEPDPAAIGPGTQGGHSGDADAGRAGTVGGVSTWTMLPPTQTGDSQRDSRHGR